MKILTIIFLVITLCFGANIVRAPNIKPIEINEGSELVNTPIISPPTSIDQHIIYQIPDIRSTGGSPGKNIVFAEDGQNVAVLYSRFGDPDNFLQVYVAYSTDRGESWIHYGPLSTINCRRTYPGTDAEENWSDPSDLRVHFAWQQTPYISGSYDSSAIYYAKEVMYPDGLITAAYRLPGSGTLDCWFPCIGVKDSFVIITAGNNSTFLTTNDCYIWRSTDYGETWSSAELFFPGPLDWMATPHFRFGSDGYMFFLWNREEESNPDIYWPYYCESFDYGLTWTQPQLIWQNTPPYEDMSNVSGWWYHYDCEVVNDTPVATMRLGAGNLDYGELWVYRPVSGSPGNWEFEGTKLVGGDSTAPQTYIRYATVAKDDRGNIYVGYQGIFETPTDTGYDCGMFARPNSQNNWIDIGMITHDFNTTEEKMLEFAHNASIVGTIPFDSAIISFIYTDAADYPTTGNLYFNYYAFPFFIGIAESNDSVLNKINIKVIPNPFQNTVKFMLPSNTSKVTLSIFDVNGKLVTSFNPPVTNNYFVWDGRNSEGSKVNAGVYFYTASSGNNTYQGKIILAR